MQKLAAISIGILTTVFSIRAEETYVRAHQIETTNNTQIAIMAIAVQPDGKTIIGGKFAVINGYERLNVARFNADGTLDTTWKVDIWDGNRTVYALAANDTSVFIGGDFHSCQGSTRRYLAKVDITNGMLDTTFTSTPNTYVYALAATGSALYVGGAFTNIGGIGRRCLARLDADTGNVDATFTNSFTNATGYSAYIRTLLLQDTNLYVGGGFVDVDGWYRRNIAKIHTGDGQVDATFSNNVGGAGNDSIFCLATDGSNFYAGGDFLVWGVSSRENVAKFNPTNATVDTSFTNGCSSYVYGLAADDDGLYVGGNFTNAGGAAQPRLAKLDKTTGNADAVFSNGCSDSVRSLKLLGTNLLVGGYAGNMGLARTYGFTSADRNTGAILTGSNPRIAEKGIVYAVAEQPDGKTVVGGSFDTADGEPRRNLARFNKNGTLDTTWIPNPNDMIRAICADTSFVYVGGLFTSIAGSGKAGLVKLKQTDSSVDSSFNPNPNFDVYSLLKEGTNLYVGGLFSSIGGQPRDSLARISTETGLADTIFTNGVSGGSFSVFSLLRHGNNLYAGGSFNQAQGLSRTNLAAFNCLNGQINTAFAPNPNDWVMRMAGVGTNIYLGGYFDYLSGAVQSSLAKISPTTGLLVPGFTNHPDNTTFALRHDGRHLYAGGFFTNIGNQSARRLSRINPSTGMRETGFTNGANGLLRDIVVSGAKIYVGGNFGEIDGTPSVSFAELFVLPPAPNALTATHPLGSTFLAHWDSAWTATNYFLDVGLDSGFTTFAPGYNNRHIGDMSSTIVTGLHALTAYYYRLRAANEAGTSTNSGLIAVTTTLDVPDAVSASHGTFANLIQITWRPVSEADQYLIYRNTINNYASATVIASVASNIKNHNDASSDLKIGQTYYYWIRTTKSAAMSAYSAAANGWLGLQAPTGLNASDCTDENKINLTWQTANGATGYQIWRNTNSHAINAVKIAAITAPHYSDNSVMIGQTYYYWVKATNAITSSGYSAPASGRRGSISSGVSADYDGDGKADPTIYDETTGTWKIKLSSGGYAQLNTTLGGLGGAGFASVSADYDGDGKADPAVYHEATGRWIILPSSINYAAPIIFPQALGGPGYSAMPADYDGDGKADPTVYQRLNGDWKILFSSASYQATEIMKLLGGTGWRAVAADYDGDGKADPAIYGEATGLWQIMLSSAGYWKLELPWTLGGSGYSPCPADYDGDGFADPAVRSATGNEWIVRLSTTGYAPITLPLPF